MHPYKPRQIEPLGLTTTEGWRLKRYSVCAEGLQFDAGRFGAGIELATKALPQPAQTAERVGVGFLILHQGNGIDYTVLGWWDRENELPILVFVCDQPGTNRWRPARGSESVCVWDLQVIWSEREAYVATILGTTAPDPVGTYLGKLFSAHP